MRYIVSVLIYIHVIYVHSAFAQPKLPTIFVQSSQVSNSEFKAFVKNARHAISLSDYSAETSPTKEDKRHLLNLLEKAQKEYLEGSLDKTRLALESLTNISREADWTIEERKSVFYAFMRLAHLATDDVARKNWLIEAARFDYELNPDKKIFPPPLCKEFEKLRKDELLISKNWDVGALIEHVVSIKVNGKKYSMQYGGSIRLMNGVNRVVLISNKGLPIIRKLNINQALALSVPANYYSIGSCDHPLVDQLPNDLAMRSALYFSEDCVLVSEAGKWRQQISDKYLHVANTTIPINELTTNTIEQKTELFNEQVREDKKSDSSKKYWLIGILATGIAAALVISSQKSADEPSKQPTHQ